MFEHQDGFPFVIGGSASKVTELHPPGIQIFQLWQIYLTNVNPLLKVTHTQTLQAQVIEAGTNPSKISRPLEALMFSIYFIAITSMSEDDVQSTFGDEKSRLLSKYHRGAQQALINAGFMCSPDIMVLQAYFLYLVSLIPIALPTFQQSQICVRQYVDPRALFCLIGIAVRVAQRLGLHRDGAQFHLPPFEVEIRRRLWWQLCYFDKRIAEITGSTITALSSSGADTRWPLNINDTDLHLHAKDAPTAYVGPTEMLFCLTGIELITAAAPGSSRDKTNSVVNNTEHTRKFHYSPSPSSPDVVTHVANQTLPTDTEGYCNYIENTYLKMCDPKIPLHFFTLMMTRQALCKLRVINFLVRNGGQQPGMGGGGGPPGAGGSNNNGNGNNNGSATQGFSPSGPPPHEDPERDALFTEAIRMVEYDNIMQSAESLRGFAWYTYMHFPFPGYMFIVSELRWRRTGELAERAWAAVAENHERRGLIRNLRSPIHVAFGPLFVKAWDAHEAAELQLGRSVQAPKFVQLLRQTLPKVATASGGRPNGTSRSTSAGAGGPSMGNHNANNNVGGGAHRPSVATDASAMDEVVMEDHVMYAGFDGMNHAMMGGPGGMPDMDFGQMDWSYLMQGMHGGGGEFGGFAPFGGVYPHGPPPGQ